MRFQPVVLRVRSTEFSVLAATATLAAPQHPLRLSFDEELHKF